MSMVGHPMLERLQGVRPMPATKEDRRRAEAEARAAAEAAAPAAAQVKRRPCRPCLSNEHAEPQLPAAVKGAAPPQEARCWPSCGGRRVPRLLLALSVALVPGPDQLWDWAFSFRSGGAPSQRPAREQAAV
jgi:hypothetical protein